jgi:hypothetical protein
MADKDTNPDSAERDGGLGDLASRLIRVGAEAVSVGAEKIRERSADLHPKDLVSGAASLGVKGKDELVTLVAGEVRGYLNKLKVGEEIRSLLTNHGLEVSASIRLKPVAAEDEPTSTEDDDDSAPSEE